MLSSIDRSQASLVAAGAGILIRYGFYLFGAVAFAAVASAAIGLYGWMPRSLAREPAFHLAPADVASLSRQGEVVEMGGARLETWHYGQIYDRGRDLTVTMVMPPKGSPVTRHFAREFLNSTTLRHARPVLSSTYYDLETRFGPVRAVQMRVNADGRQKLCLAFISRFETTSLYLRGWTCEGNGSQPSAGALACTIDHMTVTAALATPEADDFFRRRAAKRGGTCGAAPVTQTTDTRPPRPLRIPRR
ncbi:MAG: hypothetical protein AB7K64_16160 [Variibacter sp.]